MIPMDIDPQLLHRFLDADPEGTGWARSQEQPLTLPNAAGWCEALAVNRSTYEHPAEFLPDWIKIEDQGQIGSCAGMSNSSAGEICRRNELRASEYLQFSGMAAYLIAQEFDGIKGDRGSTISSGVRYATKHGYARESSFPYPRSYVASIPQAARESVFKVENAVQIKDTQSFLDWILTNQGPIFIGMRWTQYMDNQDVVETFLGPQRNDRHGGGHAVFLYGWTTIKSKVYPILWNSWSKRWGREGKKPVSPNATTEILSDRMTVAVGYTWRKSPVPEDYSFAKDIRSIWS
jgi:C1A family cysteine protease